MDNPVETEQKKSGLPKWLVTVTPLSKAIAMILFIVLPVAGYYFGFSQGKLSVRNNYIAPPVEIKKTVGTKSPSTPPDMVSDEEECIGKFLGTPDIAPDDPPTPTDISPTTCRNKYTEDHLSFSYPCNWTITPMVAKEKSLTCGYVREIYLLAGYSQAGFLTVYPEKAPIGYDQYNTGDISLEEYAEIGGLLTSNTKCETQLIGNYHGLRCGNIFVTKNGKTIITLLFSKLKFEDNLKEILSSLQLSY